MATFLSSVGDLAVSQGKFSIYISANGQDGNDAHYPGGRGYHGISGKILNLFVFRNADSSVTIKGVNLYRNYEISKVNRIFIESKGGQEAKVEMDSLGDPGWIILHSTALLSIL